VRIFHIPFFNPRGIYDPLLTRPCFQSVGVGSRRSAPVTHQVQGYGSCPIRAAISRPWQSWLPQKTIGTTPRPRL